MSRFVLRLSATQEQSLKLSFADAALIVLVEDNVVTGVIHGMIALGGRSEEVRSEPDA
jgi:hypothetical protein